MSKYSALLGADPAVIVTGDFNWCVLRHGCVYAGSCHARLFDDVVVRPHVSKLVGRGLSNASSAACLFPVCSDPESTPITTALRTALTRPTAGSNGCLKSAYAARPPPFTTWKYRSRGPQKHTIDYMFHSDALAVLTAAPTLTEAEIGPDALPSATVPSDHLPLLCAFQWKGAAATAAAISATGDVAVATA